MRSHNPRNKKHSVKVHCHGESSCFVYNLIDIRVTKIVWKTVSNNYFSWQITFLKIHIFVVSDMSECQRKCMICHCKENSQKLHIGVESIVRYVNTHQSQMQQMTNKMFITRAEIALGILATINAWCIKDIGKNQLWPWQFSWDPYFTHFIFCLLFYTKA